MVKGIPPLFKNSTFENFIVNDQNRNVFLKCIEYASNPHGFLTITGTTGSGKTHLAAAITKGIPPVELSKEQKIIKEKEIKFRINHYENSNNESDQQHYGNLLNYYHSNRWRFRASNIFFISTIRFLFELNNSLTVKNGNAISTLEYLTDVLRYDCIVLDDFGSEKLSDAARKNLFFIIDECYVNNKSLIVTSNNTIAEINNLEPRIASRLSSGQVLYLNAGDYRMKIKI